MGVISKDMASISYDDEFIDIYDDFNSFECKFRIDNLDLFISLLDYTNKEYNRYDEDYCEDDYDEYQEGGLNDNDVHIDEVANDLELYIIESGNYICANRIWLYKSMLNEFKIKEDDNYKLKTLGELVKIIKRRKQND